MSFWLINSRMRTRCNMTICILHREYTEPFMKLNVEVL